MILIKGMMKDYKLGTARRVVFKNVDVNIPTDRRVAVFGAAESGKTVLIRLLCGLEIPTEGEIVRYARVSFPVGYTRALKFNLSARQNIAFVSKVYGADEAEIAEFIERVTGLGVLLNEPMRKLTMNDRSTFCYAMGYAMPFDTYLFDNAVVYGTPDFRRRCMAMFEERARNSGIILATKHTKFASRCCDCGVVIRGRSAEFFDTISEAVAAFEQDEQARHANLEFAALEDELARDEVTEDER
ncbi:ATP-binding cassette domain-containing protein [Caulobacter sp. S45]|uniref:ATP-binding cassette domain-containing protein n=1 Tax=Caulobacter sp. S45 TaxID=1641861 RepID=UPI0015770805|nr:ATP-binding cassette domain-containing protein [Caulobacter sp. S45]